MKGIVESWDPSRGRGWIKPVFETVPKRPVSQKIEVERQVLSPSASGRLRPGQQVGFVYRAPDRPDAPGRAESVVVIADPA
ncbi:hypothetical protein HY251_14055 [bacterium]|nr:hypothetical protein [bacterium]